MLNFAHNSIIDNLKGSADIIEEASATVVYFGWCAPGCLGEDDPTWSIMRLDISGSSYPVVSTFKWASGQCDYSKAWADRATLQYYFKRF